MFVLTSKSLDRMSSRSILPERTELSLKRSEVELENLCRLLGLGLGPSRRPDPKVLLMLLSSKFSISFSDCESNGVEVDLS